MQWWLRCGDGSRVQSAARCWHDGNALRSRCRHVLVAAEAKAARLCPAVRRQISDVSHVLEGWVVNAHLQRRRPCVTWELDMQLLGACSVAAGRKGIAAHAACGQERQDGCERLRMPATVLVDPH